MNDFTTWILTCHHLEIQDVVSLFKTCRLLRSLSERQSLWSFLMRRDFPEHHQILKLMNSDKSYKDLWHHGAHFAIDIHLYLYPEKIEYVVFSHYPSDLPYVMTTRKPCNHSGAQTCLRLPGQMFVRLEEYRKSKPFGMEDEYLLVSCGRELRFGMGGDTDSTKRTSKLVKFRVSTWLPVVNWIHEHFDVEKIYHFEDRVHFRGQLYAGFSLEADDVDILQHATLLYNTICDYYLVKTSGLDENKQVVHLYCDYTGTFYDTVDGNNLPLF